MKRFISAVFLIILLPIYIFAQKTIQGKVVDSDGVSLPGVNVLIIGTTTGTITDTDGNYTISVESSESVLEFSFLGMLTEKIRVGDQTIINMTLVDDLKSLEEVVVVGYGTVKRANLAGAVSDINAKELQDMPVVNLTSALEGRLSGVRISVSSGKPGADTKFQIRESSSKTVAEEPLYVIDGIIRDKDAFDLLDPSEVESISILKDAAAAVYGAAAAGGVVLVSTKKGHEGKIKINYTGSYGITQAINTTDMLSAYEHAKMLNEGYDITNLSPSDKLYFTEDELLYFRDSIPNGGYDWVDEAWQNAMVARHSLNFSGGDEKIKYFVGANYIHETGNIRDLYVKKYGFRTSLQTEILRGLTASVELSIHNKQVRTPINPQDKEGDIMEQTFKALLQNPKYVPPLINGYPVKESTSHKNIIDNNPYAIWQDNNYSKGQLNSYTATAALNYQIPFIRGLTARVQFSQSRDNEYGKRYETVPLGYSFIPSGGHGHILKPDSPILVDSATNIPIGVPYDGEDALQETAERSSSYQANIHLSYNREFGQHQISALAVCEFGESQSSRVGWKREGTQLIKGYDLEWAFAINDYMLSPNRDLNGTVGYIGRLNYSYASKYIVEFAGRYESSTRFAPENRWGFFPSLLVGWVISEESFFNKVTPVVNFLKIRGSAGMMGNDNFKSFMYLLRYKPKDDYVLFGDQPVAVLRAENGGVVNDRLQWQTVYSYNGGVDMRFFKSLLNFSFDAFYEYTSNMLDPIGNVVPPTSGIARNNKVVFNYGRAHSYGYEIELGIFKKLPYDIGLGVSSNLSWAEARLLKVAQSVTAVGKWYDELRIFQDNQTGAFSSGIVRTQEEIDDILMDNPNYINDGMPLELGMLNHKDIRGTDGSEGPNGRYSYDREEDRTIIAEHSTPPYQYGINLNASWKGINLSMTFSGQFGHKVVYDKEATKLPTENKNVPAFWKDYWTPENPDAPLPRPANYTMEGQYSTFWMKDGHTLRLTNFNLSYALPSAWSQKINIRTFRFFFNTQNLWTIINPFDYKDANLANYNGYPMTRTYSFGVNLSL